MSGQIKTIAVEVGKTAAGFVAGRAVVVQAEKMLKVPEEADPKKKKLKEIGVGAGVGAIGAIAALKMPKNYASFAGGVATAGVISAISPFGKEDKGFIPVLHGPDEEYQVIDLNSEVNSLESPDDSEDYLNKEIDDEIEDDLEISALASPESEGDIIDVDFSEVN